MTLKALANRVRATAEWTDENPNMTDMPPGSSHWKVTLRYQGRQMTVPFSMGPALSHEPTAADVLECLLSDASSADEDFENWAADLGFDPDSRRAERIYRTVQRQTLKLSRLLGDDYDAFIQAER